MSRPNQFGETRLINMRADKEFLQKIEYLRRYYREKLGFDLSFSDLLRLCVNRVYESSQELKPL